MATYQVIKKGKIGLTEVDENQVIVEKRRVIVADIEKGDKTLFVSVSLSPDDIKSAIENGVLREEAPK